MSIKQSTTGQQLRLRHGRGRAGTALFTLVFDLADAGIVNNTQDLYQDIEIAALEKQLAC
jgi:hypothetical protein